VFAEELEEFSDDLSFLFEFLIEEEENANDLRMEVLDMVPNLYLQQLLDPFILFIVDIALDQFNIAAIKQKVNSRVVNGLLSKSQGWSVDYVPVSVKLALHLFKNQKDVLRQLREVLPFVFRFLVIRVNEGLDVEPCLLSFPLEERGCC
jgi:hypothetical protein